MFDFDGLTHPLSQVVLTVWLKVTAARLMPAVAIELDRATRAFTLCAAVFAAVLRRTGTTRILALFRIVRHGILLIWSACWDA